MNNKKELTLLNVGRGIRWICQDPLDAEPKQYANDTGREMRWVHLRQELAF